MSQPDDPEAPRTGPTPVEPANDAALPVDPATLKQAVMLELLREGYAFVVLDARRPGVSVPPHLAGNSGLVLQFAYDMPVPIRDLTVDQAGIRATLSFQRSPHACVIPWDAVYVLHDGEGRGVQFPTDAPADLSADDVEAAPAAEPPPAAKPGKKPRPSHLKLVD